MHKIAINSFEKMNYPTAVDNWVNVGSYHKVDKTEGASDQFQIWIFNFWSYGHLMAVKGKNPIMNYE